VDLLILVVKLRRGDIQFGHQIWISLILSPGIDLHTTCRMSSPPTTNGNMRKYHLCYFNFRARAELARLLFAQAEQEYEDERMEPCKWLERKPSCPFGQLPTLTVDGVQLCQAHTIARFLAREFGLAGSTSLEQARADMIVECVDDMLAGIMGYYREKCQQKQNEMRVTYEQDLPVFIEMMEKLLTQNNNGDEFIVGDQLTWADLSVMNVWYWITGFGVSVQLDNFPKLLAHKKRIESLPKIADWIKRRPETPV